MATIVSSLFITLDGVAEIDPDWHVRYFDEDMGAAAGGDYEGAEVILLGRVTYDSFVGAWPDREAAAERTPRSRRSSGTPANSSPPAQPVTSVGATWRRRRTCSPAPAPCARTPPSGR